MSTGSVFVEGAFDLHVRDMHKLVQRTGIMTSVDVVEALFANELNNQLIGVLHDGVSVDYTSGPGPDIPGQFPFNDFIDEIVFFLQFFSVRL